MKPQGELDPHKHWMVLAIAALAVALLLPSLGNGLVVDDHIHRFIVQGNTDFPWPQSWFDLFALYPDDPHFAQAAIAHGFAPWWMSEGMQLTFWRPLSSLTHALDYSVWPDTPWLMHLHSLAWLFALICVVAVAYRRFLGPGSVALVAVALYALDDARIFPATWLANRNAMMAGLVGFGVLIFHDRWRREGWKPGAALGPGAFAVALLSGESAVAVLAFLLGFALFVEQGSWKERAASLAPYGAVVVVWRVVYRGLGYGVKHSGIYIDPVGDPLGFAAAVLERAPILGAGQLALPPSDAIMVVPPESRGWLIAWGVLCVALFVALIWPMLKRDPIARFLGFGALLSLVPICAAFPHDRLLTFVGFGVAGLMARWLALVRDPPPWWPQSTAWRRLAGVMAVMMVLYHLVLTPLSAPMKAPIIGNAARVLHGAGTEIEGDLSARTLIIVNAPDLFMGDFASVWRAAHGLSMPDDTRALGISLDEVRVSREGPRAIVVKATGGFLGTQMSSLMRPRSEAMAAGFTAVRGELHFEVLALTPDGRPEEVRVTFERPLDDPTYKWVAWEGAHVGPFEVPPQGQSRTVDVDGAALARRLWGLDP